MHVFIFSIIVNNVHIYLITKTATTFQDKDFFFRYFIHYPFMKIWSKLALLISGVGHLPYLIEILKLYLFISLQALKCVVLYLILAPYDNEQSDLLHRIGQEKNLNEIPKYK